MNPDRDFRTHPYELAVSGSPAPSLPSRISSHVVIFQLVDASPVSVAENRMFRVQINPSDSSDLSNIRHVCR